MIKVLVNVCMENEAVDQVSTINKSLCRKQKTGATSNAQGLFLFQIKNDCETTGSKTCFSGIVENNCEIISSPNDAY